MKKRAIILGAGPAGLISAWKLLENGWDVEIYEQHNIVAGMCRTWKWKGFLADIGPHIYHTPDQALAEFWEKEFGDLFIKGDFWCKNVKGARFEEYWDYPLSWESISRYPRELKERILNELKHRHSEDKAKARNYTQYMKAEVGPTLQKMFFKKYPEKIWGISTDDMAPDWAPKRIEFRQKVTPFYVNQWNAAGKYGTGCIYERIRSRIVKLGGKIHLNKKVTGIGHEGRRLIDIKFAGSKALRLRPEDIVISTMPITSTAAFLGHKSDLGFRGICSVYLAYKKPFVLPKDVHWLYYDSDEVYFNRLTESKKISPFTAPKDKTLITAEITFSKGDRIDSMAENKLMKTVMCQLEKIGLAKAKDNIGLAMKKEYFVYPNQVTGYQEELSKTKAFISRYQQLYSIGAAASFTYSDNQVIFHKVFDMIAVLCGKDSSYTQVIRKTPKCDLNTSVVIGDKAIGANNRAYIVAEAGLNHNGSLTVAKQLVDKAKEAGCDAIKFQTFNAGDRISSKVKSVKYAETVIGLEETLFEMFDRLALSYSDQKELFKYARRKHVEIFSTPFSFEAVDFLESLGVKAYKIASMDTVNLPLIRYIASKQKPVIMSTGMSSLAQIEEAVNTVIEAGNKNLILLHCNSSYPAAEEEMNLKAMPMLKAAFNVPVGLSDHTFGLFVSHTAITMGADMIERHFTLDRMMEGPDHMLSSDPVEMTELVRIARVLPVILGSGIKRIQPNEYDTVNIQRKSLHAACKIRKGQTITKKMLAVKGPAGGILPKYIDIILGRKARKDIEGDFPITWDAI